MKTPVRVASGLVGAAVGAAVIGALLTASRFMERVRYFPTPVPGLEWKHAVAFGLPFLVLAWVFVARRGATASLVTVATAAVVLVGHAWSNLDWTVFVTRGTSLATGGTPPSVFVVAFVLPFALVALYHGLRRPRELRRIYADKQADAADVDAVRRSTLLGGGALLGGATILAALVAAAMIGAVPAASVVRLAPSQAVVLAAAAIALVAVVGAALPRVLALRTRKAKA